MAELSITPDTKVGELLERYPGLEEVLVSLSPSYKALKNPILRRTVARVATLRQVARAGNIKLGDLVNYLRKAAGLNPVAGSEEHETPVSMPEWVKGGRIRLIYDARQDIESGTHPMPKILNDLEAINDGDLYEIITPFEPAPLIELARRKGFESFSTSGGTDRTRTWFRRIQLLNQDPADPINV